MIRSKASKEDCPARELLSRVDNKIKAMFNAARELFFDQGYDTTSMDQVARLANVSKATVYSHFNSKEQLLLELVRLEMNALAQKMPAVPKSRPLDIEQALRSVGTQFTSFFLTDDALALHRLVIALAARFPQVGRVYFEACPKELHANVAELLREAVSENLLAIDNIDLAAIQFLSLVRGDLPLNWALCLDPPSPAEIDALIEGGIRVFLAAYKVDRQA
jgi:TetR/AcrR family transcriptional repressor of mexJK operon